MLAEVQSPISDPISVLMLFRLLNRCGCDLDWSESDIVVSVVGLRDDHALTVRPESNWAAGRGRERLRRLTRTLVKRPGAERRELKLRSKRLR